MLRMRLALGAAIALALSARAAAAGPTAQEILKQAIAAYHGARTLQATIRMTTSNSPMGPMVSQTDIKTVGGKKTLARMSISGTSTEARNNPMMAALSNVQVVDDGKTTYYYSASMQQYAKGPGGSGARLLNVDQMLDRAARGSTLRLVGTQVVRGQPTWVVEATPKNGAQGMRDAKMLLYIDQKTHLVDEVKINATTPAMQGHPGHGEAVTITMTNVKLNQPIPDSVFKFTPPPGAHETRGAPGMGGPAGSMMGGGPRPRR